MWKTETFALQIRIHTESKANIHNIHFGKRYEGSSPDVLVLLYFSHIQQFFVPSTRIKDYENINKSIL